MGKGWLEVPLEGTIEMHVSIIILFRYKLRCPHINSDIFIPWRLLADLYSGTSGFRV